MTITTSDYALQAKRRKALLKEMGDGIAIIPTAAEALRNRDTQYAFRHDSYFWYLSAFTEPEAVLVLIGGKAPKSILFCRDKNPERETWDGFRYGPHAAADIFGFDEAYSITEFDARLPTLLANRASLWTALGHQPAWDLRISAALNATRQQSRAGQQAPAHIIDWRATLDRMRCVKDTHEIKCLRKAARIGVAGHRRAMRACRPEMFEYQLEAELTHEFRTRGATEHSFLPIVAGGKNACVLHYIENKHALNANDLVLIDAGCEFAGYASDITRTFPVSGRFSAAQRDVYEVVLAAQAAAIAALRPGAPFADYHEAALRSLVQGMIDLKLLKGSIDGLIESQAYQAFYMHRAGHWLGMDVHDAGEYKDKEASVKLAPGMVLTVEPGLYIRPDSKAPKRLQGIGIRIEDDVLITKHGADVYTDAPKTPSDIEEWMRG